jgi:hypothetical protein
LRESCPMQSRFWQHTDWNTLYLSMRVLDGDVVEGEHAVEGFGKELDLEASVCGQRELATGRIGTTMYPLMRITRPT